MSNHPQCSFCDQGTGTLLVKSPIKSSSGQDVYICAACVMRCEDLLEGDEHDLPKVAVTFYDRNRVLLMYRGYELYLTYTYVLENWLNFWSFVRNMVWGDKERWLNYCCSICGEPVVNKAEYLAENGFEREVVICPNCQDLGQTLAKFDQDSMVGFPYFAIDIIDFNRAVLHYADQKLAIDVNAGIYDWILMWTFLRENFDSYQNDELLVQNFDMI